MTIEQSKQQIQLRKQQVTKAKQDIQKTKTNIPQTTQRQLRGQTAPSGVAGREVQRGLKSAREKVGRAEKYIRLEEEKTKGYEKQINQYLKTDAGKLQYAKEQGIKGKPIRGRAFKGSVITQIGVEYETPYGTVKDYSRKQEILKKQARIQELKGEEISAMGFRSPKEYYETVSIALESGMLSEAGTISTGISPEALKKKYDVKFKVDDFKQDIKVDAPSQKLYGGGVKNGQDYMQDALDLLEFP